MKLKNLSSVIFSFAVFFSSFATGAEEIASRKMLPMNSAASVREISEHNGLADFFHLPFSRKKSGDSDDVSEHEIETSETEEALREKMGSAFLQQFQDELPFVSPGALIETSETEEALREKMGSAFLQQFQDELPFVSPGVLTTTTPQDPVIDSPVPTPSPVPPPPMSSPSPSALSSLVSPVNPSPSPVPSPNPLPHVSSDRKDHDKTESIVTWTVATVLLVLSVTWVSVYLYFYRMRLSVRHRHQHSTCYNPQSDSLTESLDPAERNTHDP